MKIFPLSEGSFTIDQTKVFIPFDVRSDNLNERPRGSLLVEIQPFVLITFLFSINQIFMHIANSFPLLSKQYLHSL